MAAVKGGIEAGDLQELRLPRPDRADRGEIVRLVQRRERREGLETLQHRLGDDGRRAVIRTAMHDPVADGGGMLADLRAQEADHLVERGRYVLDLGRRPGLVGQGIAVHAARDQMGLYRHALDLTLQAPFEPVAGRDGKQLEFDARAAGVDDENGLAHDSQAWIDCLAIWLWRSSIATAEDASRARTLSAREVRMIGTRAPSTTPAASARDRKVRFLASMFPASRSGTMRICAWPATGDLMPLMRAASGLMALSNASGPSISPPVIWPRSAILHSAAASIVEGMFGVTVSTADSTATFGTPKPSPTCRSIAF